MDDLRERVAELAGIDLVDFLEEGKGNWGGGQAQGGKGKAKVRSMPWIRALRDKNIRRIQVALNCCTWSAYGSILFISSFCGGGHSLALRLEY